MRDDMCILSRISLENKMVKINNVHQSFDNDTFAPIVHVNMTIPIDEVVKDEVDIEKFYAQFGKSILTGISDYLN